ncbi:LacI family DNA-binding transcriptional regulator [Streptacidiphilus carbonis]|uniref:LacI family DNA-binding transcriptional regulator n=1 Tax=Streptacidiphilus carbonis TaxID=105422 RepID=UPI0005AA9C55|nr:LacI family DNA-binding transcriptional regulator [Streptacidiphilus carbonis]
MAAEEGSSRVPLYQQVKRELLQAIGSGDYSPGAPFVTQRQICERFGVSHATAVRALNDLAAEGYVVRRRGSGTFVAERPLRRPLQAGGSISCVLQFQGPHVSQLLAGIEATCAELGYRLYLTHCEGDPRREERALLDALDHRADGVIVYPAQDGAPESAYTGLLGRGVPLVLVDRYRPDLATDAVVADNVGAGRRLTEALIAAGHRTMATLWDETTVTSVRDRLAGHIDALRSHGITVRPDLTVLRPFGALATERRQALLADLLRGPRPPTVLICANGYVLAEAAQALLALGFRIPGDVDLAGMDDAGPFDVLPLTAAAVSLPSREMGRRAMHLLHRRISDDGPDTGTELMVVPVTVRTRQAARAHLRIFGAADTPSGTSPALPTAP